jgi:hypothetical protein
MVKIIQNIRVLHPTVLGILFCFALLFSACEKEFIPTNNADISAEQQLKCAAYKRGGQLISYELVNEMSTEQIIGAVGSAFASLILHDVKMYKVSYSSQFNGQDIIISGIVGVPDVDIDKNTPIVMYNHGTRISEADHVPSSGLDILTVVAAANGKICFASDYTGYGDSKDLFPSYMIVKADVYPVCDMILAGKKFLQDEYKVHGKPIITMFGYSQGGSVTLSVQRELESNPFYKGKVTLKGVAAGTGPYDLSENVMLPIMSGETYAGPEFLTFMFISYNAHYNLGYDLNTIFKNNYGQLFLDLQESEVPAATISASLPTTISELFQDEFLQDFLAENTPFTNLFEQNCTHIGWIPKATTRIYHSLVDEIVPYQCALNAYNVFIDGGAKDVTLITYENYGHVATAFASVIEILAWAEE